MNMAIIKRVKMDAVYMIETKKTIREIGHYLNVSKSTVHKDLHERLKYIDKQLFKKVEKIIRYHLEVRHIRGGESTKKKYEKDKQILLKNNWLWYNNIVY